MMLAVIVWIAKCNIIKLNTSTKTLLYSFKVDETIFIDIIKSCEPNNNQDLFLLSRIEFEIPT